jgi:hypothetical protein
MQNALGDHSRCAALSGIKLNRGDGVSSKRSGSSAGEFTFTDRLLQRASRHASLPVADLAVIEAANLAEAVTIVSKTPCAVAHGVVEVWPLEEARQGESGLNQL